MDEEREHESFIGEDITPKAGTFDLSAMASGEPGLPTLFAWRDRNYTIDTVLEKWKTTSPCKSGANEQYVRKHFYRIRTTKGEVMTIYCSRQPPRGRNKTRGRWVLYSIRRKADS